MSIIKVPKILDVIIVVTLLSRSYTPKNKEESIQMLVYTGIEILYTNPENEYLFFNDWLSNKAEKYDCVINKDRK